MYYVYFLRSTADSRFYVGYSDNLRSRLKEHNDGKATYTRKFRPWKLVYYEAYDDQDIAKNREKLLKQHGKRYSAIIGRLRKEEN